ncbi:MAG: methyltransferase domain-containing protein [Legionellaceae bacterium]|nr:methyltransferase domain-containing protein [Legionellaceae bacterium]
MVLDEQAKYTALDAWFKTPQGRRVAEAFASELQGVDGALSGRRLLQLGACGDNIWLPTLRFRQKWLVSPSISAQTATIYSSVYALPIERNSVDCVLAPLTMEACSRHRNPIDEIDRILKPMGYVVFLGINPWSFWGLALRYGKVSCFDHASVTLRSSLTLKLALLNRGYRQCLLSSFYYIPPVEHETWIHKLEFLNEMGKMIWPYPASFYCFIAQKYDPCLVMPQAEQSDLYLVRA